MSSRPSPLPNRVTPDGVIEATPARGLLTGNRGGRLHEGFAIARQQAGRRWISCLLAFKGRRRVVMGAGYTELFFLDEATALSAGHRPCFECRGTAARAFAAAWARGHGLAAAPGAGAMDAVLSAERRAGPQPGQAADLPDGAMVRQSGRILLVQGGAARCWSHRGYGPPEALPPGTVTVLTRPAILAALRGGYRPLLHPSAGAGNPMPPG